MPIDPHALFTIRGKAAIITGAAGGIGTALVAGFAALGARVLAVDIVDPKDLPAGAIFHRADLRDPAAVAGIAGVAQSQLGPTDILINNAGLGEKVRAEEMALEVWNNTLSTNLTGSFLCKTCRGCGVVHGQSAARRQCSVHDGDGDQDAAGWQWLGRFRFSSDRRAGPV